MKQKYYRKISGILMFLFFLNGCMPSPSMKKIPKEKYVKDIQYVSEELKNSRKSIVNVSPNSKVFFMNAYISEKQKAKDLFNYAIKFLSKKELCLYDEKTGEKIKCEKGFKIEITKPGEEAEIDLSTIKHMNKYELFQAILQFNRKYFPGFQILRPEALLKAIRHLTIYNYYLDKNIYEDCYIDGYLEEFYKKRGLKIVNSPKEADYIIIYQLLGCRKEYTSPQPGNLYEFLSGMKTNKVSENYNLSDGMKLNGTMGIVTGMSWGHNSALILNTYWTPSIIAGGVASFFLPSYVYVNGVAYEFIIIDKKKHLYSKDFIEKTSGYNSAYGNKLDQITYDIAHQFSEYH